MHLIRTSRLDQGFARVNFPDHWPCELTDEAPSFQSQGVASFPMLRKLHSWSQSRGAVHLGILCCYTLEVVLLPYDIAHLCIEEIRGK